MPYAQRFDSGTRSMIFNTAAADPQARLQITPNRQELNDRFPMLGFTISTAGLPFFEVLLTTDRGLFDASQAERRFEGNFYSSRQDSGLLSAHGGSAVYLVPPAVLSGFMGTQPHPQQIYFTMAAYQDEQGTQPVYAHDPATLSSNAPSVNISSGFRGHSLAMVMGSSTGMLRRVSTMAGQAPVLTSAFDAQIPAEDGGEPDDEHYAEPMAWIPDPAEIFAENDQDWQECDDPPCAGSVNGQAATYNNSSRPPLPAPLLDTESSAPPEAYNDEFDLDYDDGFGPLSPSGGVSSATNQQVVAPPPAPAAGPRDFATGIGVPSAAMDDYIDEWDEPEDELDEPYEVIDQPSTQFDVDDRGAYTSPNDPLEEDAPGYEPLDAASGALGGGNQPQPLTINDRMRIIDHIASFESGGDRFSAINPDGAFVGRSGTNHPAYQRYHIGLAYGIIQFSQDSGNLGKLLRAMRQRDTAEFNRIFGDHADELVRITNARGPNSANSPDGRSARVQPVGGADLWTEPWLTRFRQAGQHRPFQAAQYQTASEQFIDRQLKYAGWMGLNSERALTMLIDRAINQGNGKGRIWFNHAASPLQSPAARQQALQALGHSQLEDLQRNTPGLAVDNTWGPMSEAACTAALRALGSRSPIQIPSLEQMLDAVADAAAGASWERRTNALRDSTEIPDTLFQLV